MATDPAAVKLKADLLALQSTAQRLGVPLSQVTGTLKETRRAPTVKDLSILIERGNLEHVQSIVKLWREAIAKKAGPDLFKLETIKANGDVYKVPLKAATEQVHSAHTYESLKTAWQSTDKASKQTALEVLLRWGALIKERERADHNARGASPKRTAPPKGKALLEASEEEWRGILPQYIPRILKLHNDERASPTPTKIIKRPVDYDQELATMAQQFAEELIRTDGFRHSEDRRLPGRGITGENLAKKTWSGQPTLTGMAVVTQGIEAWINEKASFRYGNPIGTEGAGHYSQIVWRGTEKVGCGFAAAKVNGLWRAVLVCNYYPPGNISDEYADNV